MLNVVCFKWGDKYPPNYVNNLYQGVHKFLNADFQFTCITDNSSGLNPHIKIYPLWNELTELKGTKYLKKKLNCYRRLKLYDPKILDEFNYNVLALDIDTLILRDITFLSELDKNALYYCKSKSKTQYSLNPSITRIVDDKFSEVWKEFNKDPLAMIRESHEAGWSGSDQAVLSFMLKDKVYYLNSTHGIISFRDEKEVFQKYSYNIPEFVKMVSFHGDEKVDKDVILQYPWIEDFWNL